MAAGLGQTTDCQETGHNEMPSELGQQRPRDVKKVFLFCFFFNRDNGVWKVNDWTAHPYPLSLPIDQPTNQTSAQIRFWRLCLQRQSRLEWALWLISKQLLSIFLTSLTLYHSNYPSFPLSRLPSFQFISPFPLLSNALMFTQKIPDCAM